MKGDTAEACLKPSPQLPVSDTTLLTRLTHMGAVPAGE